MTKSNESNAPKSSKGSWSRRWLGPLHRLAARRLTRMHRDLFRWHVETFAPLDEFLLEEEKAYLEFCFSLADLYAGTPENEAYNEYSYYTYSHRISGERVNSSRFAFGSVARPNEVLEAALPVIQARGIEVDDYFLESPNSRFYGLGWDQEAGHFKVYFRVLALEEMPRASLQELMAEPIAPCRPEGLISFTYTEQTLHEEKVYLYPLPEGELFEGTKGRVFMCTSKRGIVTQYDVSMTKAWKHRLNATGQAILDTYQAKGMLLDTIAMQDEENFTLYFPGAFFPFPRLLDAVGY